MNSVLNIAVVDDDNGVRDALKSILGALGYSASFFVSARQFWDTADPRCFDYILLDLIMPGMNGIELLRLLIDHGIETPVIMMSSQADVEAAFTASELGAVGFMPKPVRAFALDEAIKSGLRRRDERRAQRAKRPHVTNEQLAQLDQITPAEWNVLRQVVEDKPNKVIARELGISDRTVESHRARIIEKLGTHSTVEMYKLLLAAEKI